MTEWVPTILQVQRTATLKRNKNKLYLNTYNVKNLFVMKNPTSVDLIQVIFKNIILCLDLLSKIIKRFCITFNVVVLLLGEWVKTKKAFFDSFV